MADCGSLALSLVAFLLALSKTALAIFAGCALLVLALNFSTPTVRRTVIKTLVALIIMIPVGLLIFQTVADRSFFEILQARAEEQTSLNWRTEIWQHLLADIHGSAILFGHGFTAANVLIYQMSFNDKTNATPLILSHNGYIGLMYDFGILGYLLFVSAISLAWNTLRLLWAPVREDCTGWIHRFVAAGHHSGLGHLFFGRLRV